MHHVTIDPCEISSFLLLTTQLQSVRKKHEAVGDYHICRLVLFTNISVANLLHIVREMSAIRLH